MGPAFVEENMKRFFLYFLASIIFGQFAIAQDNTQNGKVILKNGSVITGTIQTQGSDVVVTNESGDVFYFTRSEIGKIQFGDNNEKKEDIKDSKKSGLPEYRKTVRNVYREDKIFGEAVDAFWGENEMARRYYEKSRQNKRAAIALGVIGPCLVSSGVVMLMYSDYYYGDALSPDPLFYPSIVAMSVGSIMTLTACFLPIAAHKNMKYSYSYYDRYGKTRAMNISVVPELYARNAGAGIGLSITF